MIVSFLQKQESRTTDNLDSASKPALSGAEWVRNDNCSNHIWQNVSIFYVVHMKENIQNIKYMLAALKLSKRGIGSVEPNPAVGAVIVKNDKIIGSGWHRKFGSAHAEINALKDCKKRNSNPRAATMYVTLEPCCHYGKTGPCADAIIKAGIKKVIIAAKDPSKHAAGKGIAKLRKAGIEVQTGLCKNEAKLLNAPFMKFAATQKCWVILKWAQSVDGKLASGEKKQRWISNELSRKDAHKLRLRSQAILVGIKTVLADDPLLTARLDKNKNKKITRIVLDSNLRIPTNCKLLKTAKEEPVLIVTSKKAVKTKVRKAETILQKGAEILTLPNRQGKCDLKKLLDELARRKIAQLLVEGGAEVIGSFLKQNLADEIAVYIAPKLIGKKGDASINSATENLTQNIDLNNIEIKKFGSDIKISGLLNNLCNE